METINVSPSVLSDVAVCGTKAYTRHVRGYTSVSDAIKAVAGQGVHAAIATFLDPNGNEATQLCDAAIDAFHDIYDAPYAKLTADQLEPSLTPHNLQKIIERWIDMHPPALRPWKRVVSVEEAFASREWQIRDMLTDALTPVRLICRPDIIVEDHDGLYMWVDTKTTGWHINDPGWQKQLKLSLQVQLYSDAVVQRYGNRAKYGGWINAIELRKLPDDPVAPKLKKDGTPAKQPLCREHERPKSECGPEHMKTDFIKCLTTQHRVDRAIADATGYAADYMQLRAETDIANVDMRGAAKGECRFCPAAEWCLSDRPMEALEGFMKYDPWVVDIGAR